VKNNIRWAFGHKFPSLSTTSTVTNDKSFPSAVIIFLSAVSLILVAFPAVFITSVATCFPLMSKAIALISPG
jgi:hypothetical protein